MMALTAMSAVGAILCDTLCPNCRIRYITMLIQTTCRMPAWVALCVTRLKMVGSVARAKLSASREDHAEPHQHEQRAGQLLEHVAEGHACGLALGGREALR